MKQTIQNKLITLTAVSILSVSFLTVGCSRTLSKSEETRVSNDGTVNTKEKTVTQNSDGTITKTESKKTNRP